MDSSEKVVDPTASEAPASEAPTINNKSTEPEPPKQRKGSFFWLSFFAILLATLLSALDLVSLAYFHSLIPLIQLVLDCRINNAPHHRGRFERW